MRDFVNESILSETVTHPVYLIEMHFSPGVYLSTGPTINWLGIEWLAEAITVGNIQADAVGRMRLTLTVNNLRQTFGTLVLQQTAHDRRVKVYVGYPDHGIDPLLLVDGVMDGARIGHEVQIDVISHSSFAGRTPRIICAPPVFNHLPADGTLINWGLDTVEITRR